MRIKILIFTFLYLFFGAGSVLAVSVTISNVPSSANDQPFTFDVSITGAQNGTNYLRANFFPSNTTSYFGYTYNGSSYVNGADSSQYFPVSIDSSGNWTGQLQAKIHTVSSYFMGSSNYGFKVRRYTQSGSSYTWSNETNIAVNAATPTPASTSTPSSTPTPTPSPSSTTSTTSSQFSISDVPSQINSDQSFSVKITLTMPNNPNTVYYLKGAFKKTDGTRYFGLSKKDSEWIEYGDEYSDQVKITTDSSGNWSGNLEVKPDTFDNDYKGSGDYIFKVARITSSNSSTWSNEASIKINSIATTTSSPTPQTSALPTKSPSSQASPKSTPTPKTSIETSRNDENKDASVAGINTQEVTNDSDTKKGSINLLSVFGIIMILAGASLLGYIFLKTTGVINILIRLWKR